MSDYPGYIEDLTFGMPKGLSFKEPRFPEVLLEARRWMKETLPGEKVHVEASAQIHPSAVLEGPLWVGADVVVGPGAHIRPFTVLGDSCVVGHGAEVKASLCLGGSKLQSNSFAGDSMLGRAARLASGAVLANRRFDQGEISDGQSFLGALLGDFSRVGANAICAPGTLVGSHTWIGGLVHAYGVIPSDKLVLLRQQWDIKDKPQVELN